VSVLRPLLAAVVVTALCVGLGVLVVGRGGPSQPPPQQTLANVDTSRANVVRRPFCTRVDPAAVVTALGGTPTAASSYGPGENASVAPGVTDVADEYSCTWRGANGAEARAWLFDSAVPTDEARSLAARLPSGCQPADTSTAGRPEGPPAFGSVSSWAACTAAGQGPTTLIRGLFGSSWLSCSLTGGTGETAAAVSRRALRWCLVVVRAA